MTALSNLSFYDANEKIKDQAGLYAEPAKGYFAGIRQRCYICSAIDQKFALYNKVMAGSVICCLALLFAGSIWGLANTSIGLLGHTLTLQKIFTEPVIILLGGGLFLYIPAAVASSLKERAMKSTYLTVNDLGLLTQAKKREIEVIQRKFSLT